MDTVQNSPTEPSPRNNSSYLVIIGLVLFLMVAGGTWYLVQGKQAGIIAENVLPDFGQVPEVVMTERSGKEMSLGDLRGKVWVANFIFTRCAGSCLTMSSKMSDLQKSLAKAGDVKLVSFTVDPENDTPEQLTDYAEGYQAKKEKWYFLRGTYDQVQEMAKNTFHLSIEEGTSPVEPIIHSRRFILVDQQGHIRGYYDSQDTESSQKLLTDIGILMRENS